MNVKFVRSGILQLNLQWNVKIPISNLRRTMDEKIKDKVREIQDKYCGASVEYKLYKAIEETMKEMQGSSWLDQDIDISS